MNLGILRSGKLPILYHILTHRIQSIQSRKNSENNFPILNVVPVNFQEILNKHYQACPTVQITPNTIHPTPLSEKGDKSVSLKYIHMLFKFEDKETNILRNI